MKLAIHTRHDANVTVFDDIKVHQYLEMEKITEVRYFAFSEDAAEFKKQLFEYVLPNIADHAITTVYLCWVTDTQATVLREIFGHTAEYIEVPHHICHVYSAYIFTEPRETDIILSIDGGGDQNDYFHIYRVVDGYPHELLDVKINLGKAYRVIGLLSPELFKQQSLGYVTDQALSGKKMSLQSYGKIVKKYVQPIEQYYRNFMTEYDSESDDVSRNLVILLGKIGYGNVRFLNAEVARDVLATSQYVFEKILKEYLYPFLRAGRFSRLIVVGGCALNVKFNSQVEKDFDIEVFTPPCANDSGISLGAARLFSGGIQIIDSPFVAMNAANEDYIEKFESEYSSKLCTMSEIAGYLAEGKVMATFVGGLEIGPRALGNRSYLASPFKKGMKNYINNPRMKDREQWRPVAPITRDESLSTYFDTKLLSPYMTFAPKIKSKYKTLLKEIRHIDGSARVQTVSQGSWMYELLSEFKLHTGHDIIMNTSFNEKGKPLINNLKTAYDIFSSSQIDAIVISLDDPLPGGKLKVYHKE